MEITLTDAATKQFAQATKDHLNQQIAIIVDQKLVSAPRIMSPITGGKAVITLGSSATPADAEKLAGTLNSLIQPPPTTAPASKPAAANPLEGLPVTSIEVVGNDRVPLQTILDRVAIKAGQPYSQGQVNDSMRAVAALDRFKTVRGEAIPIEDPATQKPLSVKVRIIVEERPPAPAPATNQR